MLGRSCGGSIERRLVVLSQLNIADLLKDFQVVFGHAEPYPNLGIRELASINAKVLFSTFWKMSSLLIRSKESFQVADTTEYRSKKYDEKSFCAECSNRDCRSNRHPVCFIFYNLGIGRSFQNARFSENW